MRCDGAKCLPRVRLQHSPSGSAAHLVGFARARQDLMHGLELRVRQQRADISAAEALAGLCHLRQVHARIQRQTGCQRPQYLYSSISHREVLMP